MNIAKKILFGLLLSGFVFAAACGESGGEGVQKDQPCNKTDKKCAAALVCVGAAANATEGKCKEACDASQTTACGGQQAKCTANPNNVSGGSMGSKTHTCAQ